MLAFGERQVDAIVGWVGKKGGEPRRRLQKGPHRGKTDIGPGHEACGQNGLLGGEFPPADLFPEDVGAVGDEQVGGNETVGAENWA